MNEQEIDALLIQLARIVSNYKLTIAIKDEIIKRQEEEKAALREKLLYGDDFSDFFNFDRATCSFVREA